MFSIGVLHFNKTLHEQLIWPKLNGQFYSVPWDKQKYCYISATQALDRILKDCPLRITSS